jgi:glycerate 2-kinase
MHAALARSVRDHGLQFAKPCVILSGGETTVTVRASKGRGGRAVEFLLGTALELNSCPGVWAIAADTDGIDGTEDHAGAVLTPDILTRAAALGIAPRAALDANDAYGFFSNLGGLVITGPTFTNVNDFRALLVL